MRRSERREVLAVHVLHRQERMARRLRRCRTRGRRSGARPAAPSGPRCETARAGPARHASVGQKLQRDGLPEPEIVSAIDLAHAAFAEQSDNPISAVEQRAWCESAVADRVRRGQPPAVGFRRSRGRRRGAAADDANRAARRQPRWLHADAKGQRLILQCGATRGTEAGAVGNRRSAARARHDGDSTRLRAVRFGGPVDILDFECQRSSPIRPTRSSRPRR